MVSLKSKLYTVAWFAALPRELAAAVALLDEYHDVPTDYQPGNDETNYKWGRIGHHNIVLTVLSHYGDTRAAVAATKMRSMFSHIRFGLLVGIGAGVPSDHNDIRLGDVVISKPGDSSGGVVKHDMIKHGEDENGEQPKLIGMLNKPPEVLLQAVAELQWKVEMFKIQIPRMLAGIDERMRAKGYQYQGAENDRLFKDNRPHPKGKTDCSKCKRKWEKTRRIPKDDRSEGPQLFFGAIASGNIVVKSAKRRAEIVKLAGEDILCIEMEAAGLMDVIPCAIVRGICDYADSHKNKRWQNYAAATAAATAKELLLGINAYHLEGAGRVFPVVEDCTPPTTPTLAPIIVPNIERNAKVLENMPRCPMTIYRGKLNWFNNAIDESVTFILVDGHASVGARLAFYWMWTEDASGVRKADRIRQTNVRSINEAPPNEFRFSCSDEYHTFDIVSICKGAELRVAMKNPSGDSTKFTLDRVGFPQPEDSLAQFEPKIYHGKMFWWEYAVNEIFIITLPMGIGNDLPVSAHWQWTTTAGGKKKHAVDMVGMQIRQGNQVGSIDKFRFIPRQNDYYQFECTPVNDCRQLNATMSSNGGQWSKTFSLDLQQG